MGSLEFVNVFQLVTVKLRCTNGCINGSSWTGHFNKMTLLRVHYSDIVSNISSGSMYETYIYIYMLTFYLTFFPAYTLIWHLFWDSIGILPSIYSDIQSGILSDIRSNILSGTCLGPGVAHSTKSLQYDGWRRPQHGARSEGETPTMTFQYSLLTQLLSEAF